jgi:hypothetical protein
MEVNKVTEHPIRHRQKLHKARYSTANRRNPASWRRMPWKF